MLKLWLFLGFLKLDQFITTFAFELPTCFQLENDLCPNSNITFRLYNAEEPRGVLIDPTALEGLNINPLKVLIHGYNATYESTPNLELIPEFLQIPNINVISVDYSSLVRDPCYTQAVYNAHVVGRCIGYFFATAVINGVTLPADLHLIGYGIGAHVAAFASNYLSRIAFKVPHITALDPAKPLYVTPNLTERIDPSDAEFVDVVHTDIFIHGLMQSVGHVDFYPNKGVVQPDCGPIDEIDTHQCYHARSATYYAESINSANPFWAFRCKDLYGYIVGECQSNNDVEQLGYFVRHSARGNYFLVTNDNPPYSKGKDFSNLDRSLYGKTFLGDDMISKLKELGPGIRGLTSKIGK